MAVRIISALVGIIIGVSVLFIDNIWVYIVVLSAIGTIGVWELTRAVKCEQHKLLRWFCVCFSAVIPFFLNLDFLRQYSVTAYFLFVMVLLIIMLADHKNVRFEHIAMCGCGALVIPASLSCILFVRYSVTDSVLGVFLIVYLLFCAWFGDSGAYFVGTFLGKHKLCPSISPKKTVEGLIGGIVTVGVVVFIQCLIFNLLISDSVQMSYAVLIPVGMVASFAGTLGDLSASVIKRQFSVKDFGNLIPGHGGVLDRFDSVLFVAPFLYLVFCYITPEIAM
ncbi:MAG: phosphatidate cytidylyltransferase [Oscillospiraceae bacterium]